MGAPLRPMAAPVALLAMLMAPHAQADIKVVPAVALRATYTDNVRLEADATKQGQFITELTPSVALTSDGPRLKLRASFASHLFAYLGERLDGTRSNSRELSADARAKLIDDLLFFDGAASINQQNVSGFAPQVASNVYSSVNSNEVRTWRASPYVKHRFGASADAELRYARDSVKSGNASLGDSTADAVSLSIASGPLFRTVGWGLTASRQDIDDSLGRQSRAENAELTLRLRVSSELSLTAAGGYDKYDFQGLGGKSAGSSRLVGLIWTPSLRTSVNASVGKRFFGSSYALTALHRSRRTVWNLNYSDGVTSSREQFLGTNQISTFDLLDNLFRANFPDAQERRQAVDAYIAATGLPPTLPDEVNYFGNRFLLQKQLQAAAAFNGARSTAVLSLNATERRALSTPPSDSLQLGGGLPGFNDDTRQAAVTLAGNYRMSPRSGVNVLLSKTRIESLTTGATGDQVLLTLALVRQFQRSIKGSVELRHSQGTAAVSGGHTYRENAISASLSYQL
ncbi:MAG: TIGR03016 family PEP-CTERM system-associated outer membrane protein [Pseudomonadota bacterium]